MCLHQRPHGSWQYKSGLLTYFQSKNRGQSPKVTTLYILCKYTGERGAYFAADKMMFPSITFFFDVVFRKSPLPPPAHCQFGELLGKFFPFISRNVLFYLSHLCVCTLALWQLICNSRKWSSYMTLEITQHLCTKSRQKSQTPTCTSLMLKVPTNT